MIQDHLYRKFYPISRRLRFMELFTSGFLAYLAIVAAVLASSAFADDFQEGLEAFNNQDYAAALAAWMPLPVPRSNVARDGRRMVSVARVTELLAMPMT